MKNKSLTFILSCLMFLCLGWSTSVQAASASVLSVDGCCVTFLLTFNQNQAGEDWVFYPDHPNTSPVYTGNTTGGTEEIIHCYNAPGNYRYWFDQDGNGNAGSVDVDDCEENCCQAPAASDFTIEETSPGQVLFCAVNPPCPDMDNLIRYRTLPNGTWVLTNSEEACFYIVGGLEPCTSYEFEFAYWSSDCGITDYSDAVIFETTLGCDDCCATPSDISVTPLEGSCDIIEVCAPGYDNCTIEAITVEFREVGTTSWTTYITNYTNCRFIDGLEPGKTYELRVRMHTVECGYTEYSETITYTHEECLPNCCDTPTGVTITPVQGSCEEITVCVEGYENCNLLKTRVAYKENGVPGPWIRVTVNNTNCMTISGLEPGATYRFRVRVLTTECGWSPFSPAQTYVHEACTDCCQTAEPGAVTIEEVSPGNLIFCATTPCPDMDVLVRYRALPNGGWVLTNSELDCFSIVGGLDPCTEYEFQFAFWSPECNAPVYGESVFFETTGDCVEDCCKTPEFTDVIIIPNEKGCGEARLCVDGFENCENQGIIVTYGPQFSPGNTIIGPGNCIDIFVEAGVIYWFEITLISDDCPEGVTIEKFTFICPKTTDGGKSSKRLTVQNDVVVSPNPFSANLDLRFEAAEAGDYEFQLFDLKGALINTQGGEIFAGQNRFEINGLSNIPAGIYFYRLRVNDTYSTEKIIKQ